jgi:VanZ family protein
MRKYILYHAPWQLLMIIIFIISSIPQDKLPEIKIIWSDKIAHFIIFGFLGFWLARALSHVKKRKTGKQYLLWSIFISSLFGVTDEIHQLLIPGRFCSFADWLADTLGVIVFVFIYEWYRNKKYRGGSRTAPPMEKQT